MQLVSPSLDCTIIGSFIHSFIKFCTPLPGLCWALRRNTTGVNNFKLYSIRVQSVHCTSLGDAIHMNTELAEYPLEEDRGIGRIQIKQNVHIPYIQSMIEGSTFKIR